MDARTEILEYVLQEMGHLPEAELSMLERVLCGKLNDYEVQERNTDIVVHDGTAMGLLRKFLATKRVEGKAESTLEYYSSQIGTFLLNCGKRIQELETFDLRFYLSMYKEKRKVSNRTLENIRKCLSSFFSWLWEEGFIGRNPCRALKNIKYAKTVKKPFTAEDMEKLKSACKTRRDLALVSFLYSTGCRVSEVVALNASDIDFRRREVIVIGKGDKERTVYLTEVAAMHLKNYLDSRKDDNPALFLGKGKKRLKKNGIEILLKNIGKRAGVENVHPHRFRRTLATYMIDHGAAMQDVQQILGHEDIRTTQIYVFTAKKNVKQTFERYAA